MMRLSLALALSLRSASALDNGLALTCVRMLAPPVVALGLVHAGARRDDWERDRDRDRNRVFISVSLPSWLWLLTWQR